MNGENWNVRLAHFDDRAFILKAGESTFELTNGRVSTIAESLQRSQRLDRALGVGAVWVAENTERIIGYYWTEASGGETKLLDFYVDELYRGHGAADRLLKHLASVQLGLGVRFLRLVISDRNLPSLRFFRRHGAVCLDESLSDCLREYELDLEKI